MVFHAAIRFIFRSVICYHLQTLGFVLHCRRIPEHHKLDMFAQNVFPISAFCDHVFPVAMLK